MKYPIGLVLVIASTLGEAPAPYPASGWRPQGPSFELPPAEDNLRLKQTLPQLLPPATRYGIPEIPAKQSAPSNQYGAPQNQQQLPQNQYGAPQQTQNQQQQLPQNQYGTPQLTQKQQQLPQSQYGAPQLAQAPPQNTYGAPQLAQKQQQLPQNLYGAPSNSVPQNPFQQTEIKLTPQQQQQLLNQLIKLQQFLSSQKRQQTVPQNQYGAPPAPDGNNPPNQYEPPASVEPLNGDQNSQFVPNTQYLPSFLFSNKAFRPEAQGDQQDSQNGEGYQTIVLTRQEEDDYNKKYGAPSPSPPVIRRRPQSIPEAPKPEADGEENFDDASVDPNISVATAFASGRYYLLLPDGRLQRVVYKTSQSEEEAKSNGFTANLMYQFVEPIKDPIYTVDGTPYAPAGQK